MKTGAGTTLAAPPPGHRNHRDPNFAQIFLFIQKHLILPALLTSIACALLSIFACYAQVSGWQHMWGLAITIYLGFKGQTLRLKGQTLNRHQGPGRRLKGQTLNRRLKGHARRLKGQTLNRDQGPGRASIWFQVLYVVAWPGMDVDAFLAQPPSRTYGIRDAFRQHTPLLLRGIGFMMAGAGLLVLGNHWMHNGAAPATWSPAGRLMMGWVGMTGMAMLLHFGLFNVIAATWRFVGVNVAPLMNTPLAARSVSDFWSRRWNRAFRDLSYRLVLSRLRRTGSATASLIVFLMSGLIHDLVISVPARGGYGQPTLYFLIQYAAIMAGKKWRALNRGWSGRLVAWIVVLGPAPLLLFHAEFIHHVILPFMSTLRSH